MQERVKFRLRAFIAILAAVVVFGSIGLMITEGLHPFDSFYFVIVTIATVGFGDISPHTVPGKVITLERMIFPEPVIHVAVEPKTKSDQEKMGLALGRLAQEDPSFRVRTDEDSGQTIISGMGELHLEIIVDRLRRVFNAHVNVGRPRVVYRETIQKKIVQFLN